MMKTVWTNYLQCREDFGTMLSRLVESYRDLVDAVVSPETEKMLLEQIIRKAIEGRDLYAMEEVDNEG
jgi:hypothetical protein